MTSSNENKTRISVPASSANLGPGFDCLGLALDMNLTADVSWSSETVKLREFDDPLHWWHTAVQPTTEYTGTLEPFANAHKDEPNFFATAFVKSILAAGPEYNLPAVLNCRIHSDIPVGQGLGSSAAAIVAGAALADIWRTGKHDRTDVFRVAVDIEGHADNAAAAVYGGLQAALLFGGEARANSIRLHDSLTFALVVPTETLKESTGATRLWLPENLKRKDAVSNQRTLLTLLFGLQEGNDDAIRAGFEDRLHVPHRKSMIAGYEDICKAAVDNGAFGATISGAGGAMIAIGKGDMTAAANAMSKVYTENGMESTALTPSVDSTGLTVTE
ncbi:homoserine kinase [Planctomycetota bacterium]|nr:homoserine kinase [Planctomycetota bacterium]